MKALKYALDTEPTLNPEHTETEAELSKGWELFQHALAIWQLQHGNAQ